MRRSTGRAGAVGMWAWVDDLTPLVARSRFRRYTYTRSPMRDDPGRPFGPFCRVQERRVTLETRCSRAQVLSGCWLVPRAAVRAERESPAGPGGVPIQTDPELVSRAVARRPDRTHSRATSNDNARSHARSVKAPRPDAIERIPNLTLTLTLNEVRKAPRPELLERIKTHSALQRCVHQSAQRDLHHSLRHEADRKVVHAR